MLLRMISNIKFNHRFSFLRKIIKFPATRNLILISLFFTLTNCLLYQWYKHFSHIKLLIECATIFGLNLLFWGTCSFSRVFFKLFASILITGSILLVYFHIAFGITPYINTIDLILQTDANEVKELLTPSILIPLTVSFGIVYLIFRANHKLKWYVPLMALSFLLIVTIANIVFDMVFNKRAEIDTRNAALEKAFTKLPFVFVLDTVFEFRKHLKSQQYYNITTKYPFKWAAHENSLLVVLIIGESARYDKFHINGYDKPTSPYLDSNPQVISLHHYYALETSTIRAVPYIYKRSNNGQFIDSKESSFVSVFKSLGFKTYYLSLQTDMVESFYRFVAEYDYYTLGIKNRKLGTSNSYYDEILVNEAEHIIKQKGNRLLVLHMMGSHFKYSNRVPLSKISHKLNDYDNTINYTDYILNKLFTKVNTQRAIVFYTSDHGESLEGDQTRHHGYPIELAMRDTPEQIHIPGFWFFSKKYLADKENQLKFANIQKRAKKHLDQSYIFHSLLSCIGVKSPAIEAKKSLCTNSDGK